MNRAERRMSGIRGRRGTVAGLTFVAASTMVTTYGQIIRAPWAMATGGACIVDSTGDSGTGSGSFGDLRFCIDEVNAGRLGPDIFFAPLVNTVTLSAALPDIVQDTTITGGTRNVTITAGGTGFRFAKVGATGLDVTLDHLTITNFDLSAPSITGTNRRAAVLFGSSSSGTIAINNCVISGNEGSNVIDANGGTSALTITSTTFENNTSTNGSFAYGTVDFRTSGPLTVTDSTFRNNYADGAGGAIFDVGAHTTTITGSTFSGNSVNYGGGAIETYAPTMLITDSTFSGNSARHGGAIYASGYVKATRTSFYDNSALLTGAIAGGNVTLVNSFVGHNHSTNAASGTNVTGGVYAGGNAVLQFSTVYANSVAAPASAHSQMNVVGTLTSTASIIAAAAGSGGSGGGYSAATTTFSYTVLSKTAVPSGTPSPLPSPGGFAVAPGDVGLASLGPSPSPSPGWLGQAPLPTSVVYTAAPTANPLPAAGITTDQVGAPRPIRASGGNAWTIGSRQLAVGASPSASPTPTGTPTPTVTPAPSPAGGDGDVPMPTPSASVTASVFVPTPEPVGSSLTPGGSSLLVGGRPAPGLAVAPNGRGTGVDARGPGFSMTVSGQSGGGRPVALSPTGALQVGSGGRVASSGSGFMPGSQVGMFVDPSVSAASSRMRRRSAATAPGAAAGTSLGSRPVDSRGAFEGAWVLPASVVPGAHVLQLVGLAPDGSTRAVSLGVEVVQQPGAVTITATRGGLLGSVVTVTGRVTGVDAATVVPYVRSGEQGKAIAVKARPRVAADGTFTWRLRAKGTVRVFVTAGVIRSNRIVVPSKATTPTRAPVIATPKPRRGIEPSTVG